MDDLKQKKYAIELLANRGVQLKDIAELTLDLQKTYQPDLTLEHCLNNVEAVLDKREVTNAIITGIEIDIACEKGNFSPLLSEKLFNDEGLYGIDEVIALSIVNVYGSIGFTNFGFVDKLKPGIVGDIDKRGKEEGVCMTFTDDIVGGIAAAAASRVAHNFATENE